LTSCAWFRAESAARLAARNRDTPWHLSRRADAQPPPHRLRWTVVPRSGRGTLCIVAQLPDERANLTRLDYRQLLPCNYIDLSCLRSVPNRLFGWRRKADCGVPHYLRVATSPGHKNGDPSRAEPQQAPSLADESSPRDDGAVWISFREGAYESRQAEAADRRQPLPCWQRAVARQDLPATR